MPGGPGAGGGGMSQGASLGTGISLKGQGTTEMTTGAEAGVLCVTLIAAFEEDTKSEQSWVSA